MRRKYGIKRGKKQKTKQEKKFNILTFDGGGVRGALSVGILENIQNEGGDVLENTDLFSGTSTGSLIALGLAYDVSVEKLVDLYSLENMKFIFDKKHNEITRPKYDNEHLHEALLKVFPEDLRLSDLGHYVLIPSLYLGDWEEEWKPTFYTNLPNSLNSEYGVIDVAMQSCAAPIYFPSYNRHIDGGMVANDPSLACIATICGSEYNIKLEDINLLSISTGHTKNRIVDDTSNWGAMEWVMNKNISHPIVTLTLDSNAIISKDLSQKLLRDSYCRIDPYLANDIALDDYTKVPYMRSEARNYDIAPVMHWLGTKWYKL
ncbi:MAG: patatin-like phospholipase family protein [Clostridioides sp.]|jgi:patatin-like phospholipase/acyl hydrolase|nr:patatin-like phospholipase family protein [Clostridioides sp.]